MKPIGYIRSAYKETSQIPKGLGATHQMKGILEILPEFQAGLKDIDGFSHLYLVWVFHQAKGFDLTAYPPSDNKPHGVFATRSPQRPNPIGLTIVELVRRNARRLHLQGIDMLDGTPVIDVKPYLSSVPDAKLKRGWLAEAEKRATAKKK